MMSWICNIGSVNKKSPVWGFSFWVIGFILLFSNQCGANVMSTDQYSIATFAGGCFWCMQPPFDKTNGVVKTVVGYTGGEEVDPTYEQVSSHQTSHVEAIQIWFDPKIVDYEKLLNIFWHNIDPLNNQGQFCDNGNQYRSKIFTHDEKQHQLAVKSRQVIEVYLKQKLNQPVMIATDIVPYTHFYPAEDYHQDYYHKNPIRYKFYRFNCGRDKRLDALWK